MFIYWTDNNANIERLPCTISSNDPDQIVMVRSKGPGQNVKSRKAYSSAHYYVLNNLNIKY